MRGIYKSARPTPCRDGWEWGTGLNYGFFLLEDTWCTIPT